MSSRKKQKRQKKAQERQQLKQAVALAGGSGLPAHEAAQRAESDAERPTEQRRSRGTWAEPQGMGKHERPVVDLASDEIGRLYQAGRITSAQEQAARHYQELRAAYIAELPDVKGYRSCLAGSVPGFDDGDGNADVIRAFRSIEARMTLAQRREMLIVCDMEQRPRSLDTLRGALDAIGG